MPTKKGVALNIDEWHALKNYIELLDAEIANKHGKTTKWFDSTLEGFTIEKHKLGT